MNSVLHEVADERLRQDEKWGQQNHHDGTGRSRLLCRTDSNLDLRTGDELANIFRTVCNRAFAAGQGTWRHILLEEVFEALAESDPLAIREELIQVAAVAVAWVEALDRRHWASTNEVAA